MFEELPPKIKEEILKEYSVPKIEEFQVHMKINHAKKPNMTVNGDVPKKLMKEFAVAFSKPASIIMNKITQSGEYPRQWVIEYQSAKAKCNPIISESYLRLLPCTNFLSKVYKAFLKDWLIPILVP